MIAALPTKAAPHHKVVSLPLRLDGERLSAAAAPPALGGSTRKILAEIGVSSSEFADLRRSGAIYDPQSSRIE